MKLESGYLVKPSDENTWKKFFRELFYVTVYSESSITNSTPVNNLVSVNKGYKS